MKRMKTGEIHLKILFAVMVIALIFILFPLFRIAHYNFQSVDDFEYAKSSGEVWKVSHSILQVLIAQMSYTWDYYNAWQGTYFGEWITTSMMGIFSENAYYMGTYVSLSSFVLSELFAFMLILKKVLGADIYSAGIVSMSCISIQVLMTPVPVEAFYWFCSAMLYVFSHSLGIVLAALLILLYQNQEQRWKRVALCISALLLAIAVAGSNYVTALTMLIIMFFHVIWYWYRKKSHKWFMLALFLSYTACFLSNVLAPGNRKRLSTTGIEQMGAVESILQSLKEAFVYIITNTIFPYVILMALLLPFFIRIVKVKMYRYPLPGIVSLVSFGVFAAQFTPTLYTLGMTGAGRILNLYRFNYFLWLFGNELYWVGWFVRYLRQTKRLEESGGAETHTEALSPGYVLLGWLAGGILFCSSLYIWSNDTITTVSAMKSLHYNYAQIYYEENRQRLMLLEDEAIKDVELAPFSCAPYLLFFGDITNDPENWINRGMANYYGKDSVYLRSN